MRNEPYRCALADRFGVISTCAPPDCFYLSPVGETSTGRVGHAPSSGAPSWASFVLAAVQARICVCASVLRAVSCKMPHSSDAPEPIGTTRSRSHDWPTLPVPV